MRILDLQLKAFGPFSEKRLDLSQGNHGLHLIYGPNEAGKSSSLRAITDLLYGFQTRTPDNFVHAYPRLRIGAKLRRGDGTEFDIIRRKANKNSLFQADDSTPFDESEWQRCMGSVDRDLFRMMFGIDHERLRHGGEEIVRGGGKIGELLFAAGSGLADLQAVQIGLQAEIDQLLKSSGRSGSIVSDIKAYQDSRSDVKQALVSVDTWKQHDDALRGSQASKERLDERIAKERGEQNRLKRIQAALAAIGQWKKAKEGLEQVGDVPALSDDFGLRCQVSLIELKTAEQQFNDAGASIAKLDQTLAGVVVSEQILAEADAIEALRDRLGGYRKAMSDRPGLEKSQELAEREAQEILRELGRKPDLSRIEELRLPADKTIRIQNLGNQQEGLVERVQSTRRECDKIRRAMGSLEKTRTVTKAPKDYKALRNTVRALQNEGDLSSLCDQAEQDIAEQRQAAAVAMAQLGLWSGTIENAELLPVPTLATIERFSDDMQDVQSRLQTLRAGIDTNAQDQERLASQLKQLELEQTVPTHQELEKARQIRERGWQLLLRELQGMDADHAVIDDYIQIFEPQPSLAGAYRRSVGEADRIADQLRLDANRVASKATIQADMEQRRSEADGLVDQLNDVTAELQDVEVRWQQVWESLAIRPLSPREMREWLHRQQSLAKVAAEVRSKEIKLSHLVARMQAMRAELGEELRHVDADCQTNGGSLRELLRVAADQCDAMQKADNELQQLVKDLENRRADLDSAEQRFAESENDLTTWRNSWASEMQALGLQDDALPAQANNVLSNVNRLFQKHQESDQYRVRIEGIDRDARDFDSDVIAILRGAMPELLSGSESESRGDNVLRAQKTSNCDLSAIVQTPTLIGSKPVVEAVSLLSAALKDARSSQAKRESLLQQCEVQQAKQREATERLSKTKAALDEMRRQAHCEAYAGLAEVADQSRRRRELERNVDKLEEVIGTQSGGADFKAFVGEVEAVDVDTLQPQIDQLGDSIERLGAERDDVLGRIQAEKLELSKINGSSMASEKEALSESIASKIEDQIRQLAKLRMGSALLNAAIEEHRKKNQGPVLGRASDLFQRMTLGAFERLRADFNERGDPVLTGVRATTGETVPVGGMSDGTCDQLYLALRLASLETWLERHEPIPFIVDDVLLNFDDARAIAGLKVLAELSQHTQVIFFTHHAHLVDLANASLAKDVLFVRTLQAG